MRLEPELQEDGFAVGTSLYFYCRHGYELDGESELSCLDNNTWSDELPSCEGAYWISF